MMRHFLKKKQGFLLNLIHFWPFSIRFKGPPPRSSIDWHVERGWVQLCSRALLYCPRTHRSLWRRSWGLDRCDLVLAEQALNMLSLLLHENITACMHAPSRNMIRCPSSSHSLSHPHIQRSWPLFLSLGHNHVASVSVCGVFAHLAG